jgi:hypothetical protein
MAPQMIRDAMVRRERPIVLDQRGASTKISKVRQEGGVTSILSTVGKQMFRRKKLKRAANISPQMGRSILARQRGYFAGASGVRGQGRDTGTVNPLLPSARADAVKIAPRSRPIPVGMYIPKVGG